jgi:hypothetical protein
MQNLVSLMLSENRIFRDCSNERVASESCAAHAHLCNVCWPHIRAYLSECPVHDESQRNALLEAGDRFVLDLVTGNDDQCSPLAARDVLGYSWLSLSSTAPPPPPAQPANAPPAAAIAAMAAMAPLFVHCAMCAKPLQNGLVINALGKSFHSKCFACRACHTALADDATPFFDDGNGFPVCDMHVQSAVGVAK